jgi:hypothetical protein
MKSLMLSLLALSCPSFAAVTANVRPLNSECRNHDCINLTFGQGIGLVGTSGLKSTDENDAQGLSLKIEKPAIDGASVYPISASALRRLGFTAGDLSNLILANISTKTELKFIFEIDDEGNVSDIKFTTH